MTMSSKTVLFTHYKSRLYGRGAVFVALDHICMPNKVDTMCTVHMDNNALRTKNNTHSAANIFPILLHTVSSC